MQALYVEYDFERLVAVVCVLRRASCSSPSLLSAQERLKVTTCGAVVVVLPSHVDAQEAEVALKNDAFVRHLAPTFMENARLLVFRSYCKIHQCIDLGMMAKKLGMDS